MHQVKVGASKVEGTLNVYHIHNSTYKLPSQESGARKDSLKDGNSEKGTMARRSSE